MARHSSKRQVGKRGISDLRPRQRLYRPSFEAMEDRLMLASGAGTALPLAIVVGRTLTVPSAPSTTTPLPSYFVGEVQNHQVTITYTAYNEQANTETGVLLTTTLAPGVTIAGASVTLDGTTTAQLPDQSGQNLAWSLAPINGFDRESIALTVNLPISIPLQLDTGAHLYAMLDAGAISNSAPAATLRAGNVSDASLLASTPDANTTDPFIQEEAAKLNYDPTQIFNFLHTQVGYNSYTGSVRGSRGTLWSNAGNALDVASLGVALMRASGVPAQYVQGTLSPLQAQTLINSMFPTTFQAVGMVPAGETPASPANDPTLLAETESHAWFQFELGSTMTDADPLMESASIGQSFTSVTSTFAEVPDASRGKTEVKLNAEVYSIAGALFGNGSSTSVVLDQVFNDVDLVGRPIAVGNFVQTDSAGGFIFLSTTNTFTPYVELSDEANHDPSRDEVLHGTPYQEVVTNFPLGSQLLTGLFLDVTESGPGTASTTYEKTLVDRIGFAARHGSGSTLLSPVDPSAPPILSENDVWVVNALAGLQTVAGISAERDALAVLQGKLAALQPVLQTVSPNTSPTPVQDAAITAAGTLDRATAVAAATALTILYAGAADRSSQQLQAGYGTISYVTSPRLIVASTHENGSNLNVALDLMKNDARDIEAPGQAVGSAFVFEQIRGYFDSDLEGQIVAAATGQPVVSFHTVSQALTAAGGRFVMITQANVADLNALPLSPDAKARILAAVNSGLGVYTPDRMVDVAGTSTVEWLEFNFQTGQIVGVAPDGGHQAAIEYGFVLNNLLNHASLAFIGTMQGFGLTNIQFIGILLGQVNSGKPFTAVLKDAKIDLITDLAKNYASLLIGVIPTEGLGYDVLKSILGLAVGPVFFSKPLDPLEIGKEVIKLVLGAINPATVSLVAAYEAGLVAGAAAGIAWIDANLHIDPSVQPFLTTELAALTPYPAADSQTTVSAALASSNLATTVHSGSVAISNVVSASWNSTATANFQVSTLSAGSASVKDSSGNSLGGGALTFSSTSPIPLSISGNVGYVVAGTGNLAFYGPAETKLGASGDWSSYTASLAGTVTITVTTSGLVVGGKTLPQGTYLITTAAASIAGSGSSSSPDFSGSATVKSTNGGVNLGPWTGGALSAGKPLDSSAPVTFTGYNGTLQVSANGDGTDAVGFSGSVVNAVQVSAVPATVSADQSTPATTTIHVATTLAGSYSLHAVAPQGWILTFGAAGALTITPAAGIQLGSYSVRIIAVADSDPTLVSQTSVNVTVKPTKAGVALTLAPDTLMTVPYHNANLPTAFIASIRNEGPAADSYAISFPNPPAGFTLSASQTSLTIPAGATGNVGVYLTPLGQVPALGSILNLTATVVSRTDSTLTQTAAVTFTVPAIDAVTLSSGSPALSATPGAPVSTPLTIANTGNVPETVSLAAVVPAGLTASGLSNLTIPAGQSMTQTLTLTPAASVTLNTTLTGTITAAFGSALQSTTTSVALTVRSPQVVALQQAANAIAGSQIGSTLGELADSLGQLQTSPTDGSLLNRVQLLVGNVGTLLRSDPALTSFVTPFQALQTVANGGNVASLLGQTTGFFTNLSGVLIQEANQQFTISLTPAEVDLEPGIGKSFSIALTNTGPKSETIVLGLGSLPADVSAVLGQTQVTLAAGASASVPLTMTNTLVSAKLFNIEVIGSETLVKQSATAIVSVEPAAADVLGVTVNPATPAAGTPVSASAEIFNTANAARNVVAKLDRLDPSGKLLSTPAQISVSLVPGAGDVSLNLGQIATTGLANGVYFLRVSLLATDGTAIPGQTSQTAFEVGQPVTATVAASPTIVPIGTSTVKTTISVSNSSTVSSNGSNAVGTLGDVQAFYYSKESQSLFGLGQLDGTVIAIENASSTPIVNGVLTVVEAGGLKDTFNVGTVAVGKFVLVQPGISDDKATGHTFFKVTGTLLDESDNGPNANDTQFEFTGTQGTNHVDSGIFTPAATAGLSNDGTVPNFTFLGGPGNNDGPANDGFGPRVVASLTATPAGGTTTPPVLPIALQVGYADNLRRNPFFPNPWNGSPNTTFVGENTSNNEDSGAIRIINTSTTSITVNDVSVTLPDGAKYDLWGSHVVPAGASLVLAQTNGQNFDTSDRGSLSYPNIYPDGETLHASRIAVTVNGVILPTFLDTGHVLTTGGSDLAAGGSNESQNWRPIGTTGVTNLGGLSALVTVTHNLPASGYTLDSKSISPTATSSSSSQVVWSDVPIPPMSDASPTLFQLSGTVANMAPGQVRRISTGTTVATSIGLSNGQQLNTSIPLAAVTVAADHIISLAPPSLTVDRSATGTYEVSLTNPLSTPETYTLTLDGLAGDSPSLAASVKVGPGATVQVPLTVNVPVNATPGTWAFSVSAQTLEGGTDAVQGQLIVSPDVMLASRSVFARLNPSNAVAGPGTQAVYQVVINNTGDTSDTYTLSGAFPSGFGGTFTPASITVAPGTSNAMTVVLSIKPRQGASAGSFPFNVTATSTTDPTVKSAVSGTITVVNNGVKVGLSPVSNVPGATLQETVTNTGTVSDTFALTLGGPAALVSTLSSSSVTLAPGASKVIPIGTGAVKFAVPGNLGLTAIATSMGNPAVKGGASANLAIAASQSFHASLAPSSQALASPGKSSLIVTVNNTGNTEDHYSATIIGTTGPLTASLIGLDGLPTQSIPLFRLPGLSTGAILLQTNLSAFGAATVTIEIKSLTNGALAATLTASITATKAQTPPPGGTTHGGGPTSSGPVDGPEILTVKRYGYHLMPTTLVLAFNQPVDPATAQDVNNYVIIDPHGNRVKVRSAVYDSSTDSVTVYPARLMDFHYGYKLTVSGVTNKDGLLLDGNGDGKPGGSYVTVVDRSNLVWGKAVPTFSHRPATSFVSRPKIHPALAARHPAIVSANSKNPSLTPIKRAVAAKLESARMILSRIPVKVKR